MSPLDDFRNVVYYVWTQTLGLPQPTEGQYILAGHLADTSKKRRMVQAFRGVGKSYLTGTLAMDILRKDRDAKILVISANKQRSDDFAYFCQKLMTECPLFTHLKPTGKGRDRLDAWDVAGCNIANAPSIATRGIHGQLEGCRATHIIMDDVEILKNSNTEGKREELMKRVAETESILIPGGEIIVLGTPQTQETVYTKLIRSGYDCMVYPARVPEVDNYEGTLAENIAERMGFETGAPTDPERFGEDELLARLGGTSLSYFKLHFMLDTSLSDAERYPLKQTDLICHYLDPEIGPHKLAWGGDRLPLPNLGLSGDHLKAPASISDNHSDWTVRYLMIDPSGRGTDETGWCVVSKHFTKLYVLDFGGLKGGYDEKCLNKLCSIAEKYRVNKVIYEANYGDGMYGEILKPVLNRVYPCQIEEVKNYGVQKEHRIIDSLEPVMNQHRLVLDREAVERDIRDGSEEAAYSLIYQMTHLTRDRNSLRHDDRLDAMAMAVAFCQREMSVDQEAKLQAESEKELEAALRSFLDTGISLKDRSL